MSSQELKKKEKGKEIITIEENPSTSLHHVDQFDHTEEVSMYFSEQRIAALLQANKETYRENIEVEQSEKDNAEKVGIQEKKSSSSKITPCIFYTSDEKARLRWSSDLHDCFVNAVAKLGGPDKATPKSVKEIMEVEGIALHHVKSHLQKFRLGKCNIRNGADQHNKRFKTVRGIAKTCALPNPSRPQVNIKPKVMGVVKPKKAKDVQGSLYMLIEHDLHLKKCREAERMQTTSAVEKQHNMLEAHYLKASITPSLTYQHNNYSSTRTTITQQPSSQKLEQWLTPLSHHFSERETNPFTINDSQQPTTIIPQTTTSVEDFCKDNMACLSLCDFTQQESNTCSMYEPRHAYTFHSTQEKLPFNNNHNYNMPQGFINPYMSIEPHPMSSSSTITTQQQLQLNDNCVIHDSFQNATFLDTVVPPTIDSPHQGTSNNTIHFWTTPLPVQTYIPHNTYSSYPPYNTLEVVKTQLRVIQNSTTSQIRETPSHETDLSSPVTRDEVDPVDKYIDWGKVEEMDIELDPVEVLQALGFGVSP